MAYFYDAAQDKLLINGIDDITDNAIPVTDEQYQSIIDAKMSGQQIFVKNDKIIIQPPKPSDDYDWDGSAWVLNADQQAAQKAEEIAKMRERINVLRNKKSAGGVYVEQLGKWFDSDKESQLKLNGFKNVLDEQSDMVVTWTAADDTEITNFGKPQLMAVMIAILQAENHNHTVARQHKAALELAENTLEYDYSGGWSKTYADYLEEQTNV